MDEKELQQNGVRGWRLYIAKMLKSKPYDILMIFLIVIYTLLIFLILSFDNLFDNVSYIFIIIELAILGIFIIEISLHVLSFA